MENTKKKKKITTKEGYNLGIIKLIRHSNQTLNIYLKLNKNIEEIFKSNKKETSRTYLNEKGEKHKYYNYANNEILNRLHTLLLMPFPYSFKGYGEVLDYGTYNYSILRTVGISKGINLQIRNEIYSMNFFKEYITNLRELIKNLYKEFIREVEVKTTLTIKELWIIKN